jgi:uncharacterized protein (UPF0333 family)
MKLNLKYVVIAVILLAIGFLAGFYTKDSTNKTQTTITYQVNTANDCSWANGKIDLDGVVEGEQTYITITNNDESNFLKLAEIEHLCAYKQ